MKKIAIIGAGGFGREVKMLIDQINQHEKKYDFIGYFDDGFLKDELINNFPVLGNITDLNNYDEALVIAVAIGNPNTKKQIISQLKNKNIIFENLIHPSVIIGSDEVSLGYGNIICANCIITVNIKLRDFITLNLACTVGHDTVIESYTSIMPQVAISGEVVIEQCCYIGTGAKIINQVTIGKNTKVGAGAVVSKSLPENCTAVGIPAKPIKFNS